MLTRKYSALVVCGVLVGSLMAGESMRVFAQERDPTRRTFRVGGN